MTGAARLITAVLPDEVDTVVLARMLREMFPGSAPFRSHGRGYGASTHHRGRGPLLAAHRHMLSVIVAASDADAVFDWFMQRAGIDWTRGGVLYRQCLAQTGGHDLLEGDNG